MYTICDSKFDEKIIIKQKRNNKHCFENAMSVLTTLNVCQHLLICDAR